MKAAFNNINTPSFTCSNTIMNFNSFINS